jgi:hypothetical protein
MPAAPLIASASENAPVTCASLASSAVAIGVTNTAKA